MRRHAPIIDNRTLNVNIKYRLFCGAFDVYGLENQRGEQTMKATKRVDFKGETAGKILFVPPRMMNSGNKPRAEKSLQLAAAGVGWQHKLA